MVVLIQDMNDYQSAHILQQSVLWESRQHFKPVRLCRFIVELSLQINPPCVRVDSEHCRVHTDIQGVCCL